MNDFPIERVMCLGALVLAAPLLAGCTITDSKAPNSALHLGCGEDQQVYFHCAIGSDSFVSLCGGSDGKVLYRETALGARRDLTIRNGVDASFHYNRFTRARATHEEVSFDFQGERYTIFSYDDTELGKPQVGRSIGDAGGEGRVEHCTESVTSRLAPLEESLPCDVESALGCP